jgi:hypothetical protein
MPSEFHPAPFQIDHIIARQHGGASEFDNLALACLRCNRYKRPNIAGIDPQTGEVVRLFDPRRDRWTEHFFWNGAELRARTAVGRVTLAVLAINDPELVARRKALQQEGVFGE